LNHLFKRIGNVPAVRTEIMAKVSSLLRGGASELALHARINYWKELISRAYENDPMLGGLGISLDIKTAELIDTMRARISHLDQSAEF
jgi:hypothetical protein